MLIKSSSAKQYHTEDIPITNERLWQLFLLLVQTHAVSNIFIVCIK